MKFLGLTNILKKILTLFYQNNFALGFERGFLLQLHQGTQVDQLSRMLRVSVAWTSSWFTPVDASLLCKRSTWPPAWRTTPTCLQVSQIKTNAVGLFLPRGFKCSLSQQMLTCPWILCFCSGRKLGWHRPGGAPPVCGPGVGSVQRPHEPQFSQHFPRDDPARTLYTRVPGAQWSGTRGGRRPAARTGGGGADRRGGKHCRWGANHWTIRLVCFKPLETLLTRPQLL